MKILIVGGTFDLNGGKGSKLVQSFYEELKKIEGNVKIVNGGKYNTLDELVKSSGDYEVVFWWANVPDNDLPKLRNVKEVNPKILLVSSKRNDNEKYSFAELINRALELKANLTIEFAKQEQEFKMSVFDPLGNVWSDTTSVKETCRKLYSRLVELKSYTRQATVQDKSYEYSVPEQKEFFQYIKECAEIFHEIIRPDASVSRFLGNSSYRCQRGFPSFRDKKDSEIIYVSQRNIDKRFIDKEGFVPTRLSEGKVLYSGNKKPSVDTPIQLRLYQSLPKINYMVHSHCFVETTLETKTAIPCGCLEEVSEILKLIPDKNSSSIAINLKGHGCIVMGNTVEILKEFKFKRRITPEYIND